MSDIKNRIRAYIVDNFLFGDEGGLEDNTSFLDEGIIDSTGVLELVDFIEREFQVVIVNEDLIPENFDSINNIAGYLKA